MKKKWKVSCYLTFFIELGLQRTVYKTLQLNFGKYNFRSVESYLQFFIYPFSNYMIAHSTTVVIQRDIVKKTEEGNLEKTFQI